MALKHQIIALFLLSTFTALVFALVGPAWVVLVRERTLAERLDSANRDGVFAGLGDQEARLRLQKIGREEGFHLSSDDVIHWTAGPLTDGLSGESYLGYALSLRLPVFHLFHFELVAVRSVKLAGTRSADR